MLKQKFSIDEVDLSVISIQLINDIFPQTLIVVDAIKSCLLNVEKDPIFFVVERFFNQKTVEVSSKFGLHDVTIEF